MPVIRTRIFAPLAALLVAGCGAAGGLSGGEVLPATDNVLPAVLPAGTTAGIEGYLVAGTGTWRIDLDGSAQTAGSGSVTMVNALNYDPDLDLWTVNLDGTNYGLEANTIGSYETLACAITCAGLFIYDNNPVTSQYGTFAYGYYADNLKSADFYTHFGLKTDPADMPVRGTASYAGVFSGSVTYTDSATVGYLYDYLDGTATLAATFSATGGTVSFLSAGSSSSGGTYSLTGNATVTGNTYAGTVTGQYDDGISFNEPSLQLDPAPATGGLSGAFYGPASNETAGIVYATSAPGDPNWGEIAGGFWAGQTANTP